MWNWQRWRISRGKRGIASTSTSIPLLGRIAPKNPNRSGRFAVRGSHGLTL
jgi:hypothetical protein